MPSIRLNLPPIIIALLSQFVAFSLGFLIQRQFQFPLTIIQFSVICGIASSGLGYLAQLPIWWIPIQIFFIPIAIAVTRFELPPWTYLSAFLILLVVYWSTYRTRVPLYLTSNKAWTALEGLLPSYQSGQEFTFIDVGCGLGGVLKHLAKARPEGIFYGVEYAPLPWLISWGRIKLTRQSNCQVTWGSFWEVDLSRYDVVYAYLSPVPMPELWQKVSREMRPDSLFISNTFDVPGQPPAETVQIDDLHGSILYLWRI